MLDRKLLFMLYEQGHGYAEIGRKLNVSRQRIHQIVANYKNTGRDSRAIKYKELLKKCGVCRNPAINLHHLDFNNKNDEITNLFPVCKDCHYKIHKDRGVDRLKGKWSFRYNFCIRCQRTKFKHWAKGYCSSCYANYYRKIY